MLLFAVLTSLLGCSEPIPPLFDSISQIEVRVLSDKGLNRRQFNSKTAEPAIRCLVGQTTLLPSADALTPPLLRQPILLNVTDRRGTRSFELLTHTNMKTEFATGARYFENPCIHDLVRP